MSRLTKVVAIVGTVLVLALSGYTLSPLNTVGLQLSSQESPPFAAGRAGFYQTGDIPKFRKSDNTTLTLGTGAGSTTLQDAYDNSVTGKVTLTSKVLEIWDASPTLGGALLSVKDASGVTAYATISTSGTTIASGDTDGASAKALRVNTVNAWADSSARLLVLLNADVEKMSVSTAGKITTAAPSITIGSVTLNPASPGANQVLAYNGSEFVPTTMLSAAISTGQLAFATGSNALGGDAGLQWDNTTKFLGIGGAPLTQLYLSGIPADGNGQVFVHNGSTTGVTSNLILDVSGGGSGAGSASILFTEDAPNVFMGNITSWHHAATGDLLEGMNFTSSDAHGFGLVSGIGDGSSSVGFRFRTSNDLSASGAKLITVENDTAEKYSLDRTGMITTAAGSIVLGSVTLNPASPATGQSLRYNGIAYVPASAVTLVASAEAAGLGAATSDGAGGWSDVGNGSSTGFPQYTTPSLAAGKYLLWYEADAFATGGNVVCEFRIALNGGVGFGANPSNHVLLTTAGRSKAGRWIDLGLLAAATHTIDLQWRDDNSGNQCTVSTLDYRNLQLYGPF